MKLSGHKAAFFDTRRIAYLATADRHGEPHVVPVCFVRMGEQIYITIDQKPKRLTELKRLRNIAENSSVALTVEHYDDADWSKLGWLMIRGKAVILRNGSDHDVAQAALRAKYHQLQNMELESLPVIAIQVAKVASWGDLTPKP
jgi:PPOX class probable F420-dependent enzyme